MIYIALVSVVGVVVLQLAGLIPLASVGGPMVIALAFLAAALAVAIQDAWINRRGVLGWIVNIVVTFIGVFVVVPLAGPVIAMLLGDGSGSLAATGGPRFAAALAGGMLVTLLGAWGALWIVNRWR